MYFITSSNTLILFYFSNIFNLDQDFTFKNKIYLKNKAQIDYITIQATINNNEIKFNQPQARISMGSQTDIIPLECLIYQKTEITFNEPGLNGCLMIIDYLDEKGKSPEIRSAIYISPKARSTLFTQLYLLEKEISGFTLIYSSPEYNQEITFYRPDLKLLGPIKIWEIKYPENIKTNPEYLSKENPTGRIH